MRLLLAASGWLTVINDIDRTKVPASSADEANLSDV